MSKLKPLIISASYKTDIPAFYGEWFMSRLRDGYCAMVNPYNQHPIIVRLFQQDVAGIVFWTKNIGPFMKHLDEVRERGYPFVIQHTINGYAQSRFEAVVSADEAVKNLHKISEDYGPNIAVWRYDPIVLSSKTTVTDHIKNFTELADKLQGAVNEVVVSFVQPYKKTLRNMASREEQFEDFTWFDRERFSEEMKSSIKDGIVRNKRILVEKEDSENEKRSLAQELARIAGRHDLRLSICSQEQFVSDGYKKREAPFSMIGDARCVDKRRMLAVAKDPKFQNSVDVKYQAYLAASIASLDNVEQHGNRGDCACFASRDIGEYDTCPYGCAYCYAVSSRKKAKERFAVHDPKSVFLFLDVEGNKRHEDFLANLEANPPQRPPLPPLPPPQQSALFDVRD